MLATVDRSGELAGDEVSWRAEPSLAAAPPFRSLDRLALAASIGIALCMVLRALLLVGVIERFPAAAQMRELRTGVSLGEGDYGFDEPSAPLSAVWSLLVLVTAVLVVSVLHRGYRNRLAFRLPLPRNPRWYAVSWFIPIVGFFAPYGPTKAAWEGTTRDGPPASFPFWWAAWVLAAIKSPIFATHAVASGWQAMDEPYRVYEASTALLFGGLTIVLLLRLAREQKLAAGALTDPDPRR
jgi:hypothetical protein